MSDIFSLFLKSLLVGLLLASIISFMTSCLPSTTVQPEKVLVKVKVPDPGRIDLEYCEKHDDPNVCPQRCDNYLEALLSSCSEDLIISYTECLEFGRSDFWYHEYNIRQTIIETYNAEPLD